MVRRSEALVTEGSQYVESSKGVGQPHPTPSIPTRLVDSPTVDQSRDSTSCSLDDGSGGKTKKKVERN